MGRTMRHLSFLMDVFIPRRYLSTTTTSIQLFRLVGKRVIKGSSALCSGLQALEQMALEGNGLVKDPATGQTFPFEQTKKAFIV